MIVRFLFIFFPVFFLQAHINDIETLYSSQDPKCLTKLFAFYHLHKDNEYGKKAIKHAFSLINKHRKNPIELLHIPLFHRINLDSFLSTLTKQPEENLPKLSKDQIAFIENISDHLHHKKLKGHHATTIKDIQNLPSSEIDLSRAIFLSQYGEKNIEIIKSYEASLDLFALSILARLKKNCSKREIVEKISYFIFYEMLFRFPPHSLWIEDVDQYTFLPSILDSHHGVCLGVSILYLSLAQRLGVDLTICTPPGHIYLSHRTPTDEINIETTARGIHMPTSRYLSIQTKYVEEKSLKEVIGLYHVNAASVFWQKKQHKKAIEEYNKALLFMPDDPLIETFVGYNYLFLKKKKKGLEYLNKVKNKKIGGSISKNTIIEDFIANKVDENGIKIIYTHVNETRDSIIKKQKNLERTLEKFPNFREGIFHLAITWLQLGRKKEALKILNQYHQIDSKNPIIEYYLTYLNFIRLKPSLAKRHYKNLLFLLEKENHNPECIKDIKKMLKTTSLLS